MKEVKYPNLFKPIMINKTMIKNRIIATPVGPRGKKAYGGAGIVITGSIAVDSKNSFWASDMPYAFSKYRVGEVKQMVLEAHAGGAKISAELMHCGRNARVKDGDFAFGPCDGFNDDGCKVKALTKDQLEDIVKAYAKLAKDCKDIGFDLLFMHFAHGWLPAQFLSPLYNHREDEFGGSLENRARFPLMILKAVREAVGTDFPIDMRISSVEYVANSIKFEDTLEFIKMAENYIDSVQISCGLDMGFNYEGNVHMSTTIFEPHFKNVEYASEVKRHVKIPVSAVGGIMSPQEAEELIASGKLDMVAIGRAMVADPEWSNKALYGIDEDIVPCVRCLQCYHIASQRRNVGCTVNPIYSNENIVIDPKQVEKNIDKKKVVVVGAGPAGIRAALAADLKGNEVILIEKESCIGGMLRYISKEHYKEDMLRYYRYLKRQVEKSNINLLLNTVATKKMIEEMAPDYLIVAIGGEEIIPNIPGVDKPLVISCLDAIERYNNLKNKIVIIGGGTVGSELALALSEIEKKEVTIIEVGNKLASKGNLLYQISLRQHMDKCSSLTRLLNTKCIEIKDHSIIISTNNQIKEIECDHVILATGFKSKQEEANSFFGIIPNTILIGDCLNVRTMMEATFEGYTSGINTR